MKSAHNFLHWRLLVVFALVLGTSMIGGAPVLAAATGVVTSTATPSNATPAVGQTITVAVNIDVSGVDTPDNSLGAYSSRLDWNTEVLAYQSHSGAPPTGFTGVVNTANVASGYIAFNGSNAAGASGNTTIINITFDVVAAGTSTLDLSYSSMAAAGTFNSLTGILTITDGSVTASGAPTCYALTLSHTGTGSDPMASPTNSIGCAAGTYFSGASVTLTATPGSGYAVGGWTGTTNNSSTSTTNTVTMPAAAHAASVNYVASSGVVSSATPSNAAPSIGQQIVVTINIDMSGANSPDNKLGSFTGSLAWDPTILLYNTNSGLQAGFTGAINTANVGTGSIAFNGANASGVTGNIAVFTMTFDVVGVGTSALDLAYSAMAAATTFTNLLPNLTVNDGQVVASPAQYTLTVAVSPSGGGTTVPTVGAHSYTDGTVVAVTATPAAGYTFSSWSGACIGSGACSVTMDADKTVTANFTVINHNLTTAVSPAGGGTISPTAGVHAYAYGTVVAVTATPAAGYTFSSWSGACTGSGACSVTMDADKTVTANFTVLNHNLTTAVSPAGGGTVNPTAGVHSYAYGTVVAVTATPAAGYTFSSWSGACTGSGACSVTMDADKTVTANFTQLTRYLYYLPLIRNGS